MRQMLLLSLHWSREFALGHTRRGSLAPAPVLPPIVLCVWRCRGLSRKGRSSIPGSSSPRPHVTLGLWKATGSLTII